MRDLIISLSTSSWEAAMFGLGQAARLMALPLTSALESSGGSVKSATAGARRQIAGAFQATVDAGNEFQRKSIDLMFDFLTLRPMRETIQSIPIFSVKCGPGYQSQPELEYLKAINDAGPAGTTLMILAMSVQYSNLNRATEGVERLESYLEKYTPLMEPPQRAVYLSCLALLRAASAQQSPFWQLGRQLYQITRMRDELKEAKRLTEDEPDFSVNYEKLLARWVEGLMLANLPWPFGDKQLALEDLLWCERTITHSFDSRENGFQFLREVYYNLGVLYRNSGDQARAQQYLKLSGYTSFDDKRKIFQATAFATTPDGLRNGIKQIKESVAGKVFTISGFDMSEFNFIISEDGQQLLAVDTGSRMDTAEAAYNYFQNYYLEKYGRREALNLPPLTKVFVTHYHWDHAGGHPFFHGLNESVEFYSNHNFHEEAERAKNQPPFFDWILGIQYNPDTVRSYVPTVKIQNDTELVVGGTRIQLLLPHGGGGETPDGMLVYLPNYRILYAGDFIVPWVGSPYVVEGDVDSLLGTLDLIAELKPRPQRVLHGHWALTMFYPTVEPLIKIRPHLAWLRDETLKHIYAYKSREEIQAMNLIPSALLDPSQTDVQFPYLAMREVFINRLFHQKNGYWGPQLQNVDYLSDEEIGAALSKYLRLSEDDFAEGIERMIQSGDFELAARIVDWSFACFPNSGRLKQVRDTAFMQLKQKWQLLNVFKFVMYSEHIGNPTPQTTWSDGALR